MQDEAADPAPGGGRAWDDSRAVFRRPLLGLALLSCVAGLADGVSLVRDGVFVANQSGNLVHLGMAMAGQFGPWREAIASLLAFGAGAALGHAWSLRARPGGLVPPARILVAAAAVFAAYAVLVSVAPAQGVAAGGPVPPVLVALSAFAMGGLAVVVVRTGGVRSTTTYQTGTVVQTSQRLLALVDRRTGPAGATPADRRGLPRAGLVAMGAYVVGGALGALSLRGSSWWLLLPAALLVVLLLDLRSLRMPPPTGVP